MGRLVQVGFLMTAITSEKSSVWTMFQGVLLIICGALAILFPLLATIAVEQVFAALLLIVGGYALAAALGKKSGGTVHRIVSILWAALTLATGLLLVFKVIAGVAMLTILLASYFAAQGIMTLLASVKFRGSQAFWMMVLNGIVSVVLAWMLFRGFPGSAVWALGLLLGINLIFSGAVFISMALALRSREV